MDAARALSTPVVTLLVCAILIGCTAKEASVTAERPPVPVEVTRVAPGNIAETVAVVGTLAPKFQGDVKSEYSGVIAEVYVSEWVRVKKGMLLARFDTREAQSSLKGAVAARMQAEVGASRARRELERAEKLRRAGLATQQQLDDARSAADAAQAAVAAAVAHEEMARTRLVKTDVRAPMDGVIAERSVNPGDFIENMGSPRPMFRIVDNRRLELTVSVPSSSIARVTLGQPLHFTTDAVPGRRFEGRVTFINPAAEQDSGTVKVIAVVENEDGALKSGFFAKGVVQTGERQNVLRVPRTALVTWDPATQAGVIYVVNGDRVQRRSVTTGAATGAEIEIANGLTQGDAVVIRGGFNVRDGDRVTIAPAAGA